MARSEWTATERLIAEQAVALHREVMVAMQAAPHGQGLAVTEAAVMQGGTEFLRNMLQATLSAQAETQKRGSARGPARAGKRRGSKDTRRRRS